MPKPLRYAEVYAGLQSTVLCDCGHLAIHHHGVDTSPRNGGCFGSGSGHPWSAVPKCTCVKTCVAVTYGPRPDECCGKCPPISRGGYDCTCAGNPRCRKPDVREESNG